MDNNQQIHPKRPYDVYACNQSHEEFLMDIDKLEFCNQDELLIDAQTKERETPSKKLYVSPKRGNRDRFFPNRANSLLENGLFSVFNSNSDSNHARLLREVLLGKEPQRLFSYSATDSHRKRMPQISSFYDYYDTYLRHGKSSLPKVYKIHDDRVLDAPGLYSDYYSHLLSCSKNNMFTTLESNDEYRIYCCTKLEDLNHQVFSSDPMPHSVIPASIKSFGENAVVSGWSDGILRKHTLRAEKLEKISEWRLNNETLKLNCIARIDQNSMWAASFDGYIFQVDARVGEPIAYFESRNNVSQRDFLIGVDFNRSNLIAFGTSDGYVKIWDIRKVGMSTPVPIYDDYQHKGTGIKSLAFNPNHSKELVSGGGTACSQLVLRNIDKPDDFSTYPMSSQIIGISWMSKPNTFSASSGYSKTVGFFSTRNKRIESLAQHEIKDSFKRNIYMDRIGDRVAIACETYDNNEGLIRMFSVNGLNNASKGSLDSFHPPLGNILTTTGPFTIR